MKMVSFNFGEMPVRISDKDGNPWFVLSDICKVLDLANPSKAAQALDDDERSNLKLGRQGDGIIISEPGLYRLIMRSDKPQAKPFQKWVTGEVLPMIRKTGGYIATDLREEIDRTFGICQMLSKKVTEIERAIPSIIGKSVEAAIASDPRRAVMNFVSVRTLLDEAKAIRKGRNSLNRKIGHALRDLALVEPDGGKAARCPHSGTWLFQCDFAARYMRDAGKALVKQHNDRVNGQGALRLIGGKAKDHQPSTGV